MIFIWPELDHVLAKPFGNRICGIQHYFKRPDIIVISQKEIDTLIEKWGKEKVEKYMWTPISTSLALNGKILISRFSLEEN